MTHRRTTVKKAHGSGRSRTLFMSIAVTFVTLCVFLAVSSIIRLNLSTDTFRREQNRVGSDLAAAAATRVRNQLHEYLQLCDLAAADRSILDLSDYSGEDQASWIPLALDIRSTLLSARANFSDLVLEEFLVFAPESRTLVTSTMVFNRDNLPFFLKQHGIDEPFLQQLPPKKYGLVRSGDGICWITRGIFRQGVIRAWLMLGFRPENLFARYFSPEDCLDLAAGEQLLFSSGDASDTSALQGIALKGEGAPISIGVTRYYLATASLTEPDLSILSLKNAEKDFSELRQFYLIGLLQIGISVLIMLGLGFVFTYRIYNPIRRLLTNAMLLEKTTSVSQAMETVGDHLQRLSDEKEQVQLSLQETDYLVQGERLRHLLSLPDAQAEPAFQVFLKEHHFVFGHAITETPIQYSPVLSSDPAAETPVRDQKDFYSLSYMLLSSTLNEKFNFLLVKYAEAFVLLTDGKQPGDLALVQQAVAEYLAYLREYGITGVLCAATMLVHSVSEMRVLMNNVPVTMENLRFYQGQRNAKPDAADAPFPSLPQMRSLTRLLETGKQEEAKMLLIRLLDQLFDQSADRRYCVRRVQGLLMMVMTVLPDRDVAAGHLSFAACEERIISAPTVEALKAETLTILEEILEPVPAEQPESTSSLFREIEVFLEEHYMDHNLNMSALSMQFSLNESTLSRLFRQERDTTFLEYLQSLRVRKAKDLLKTESVKETARLTGFWDTQALIRVFKKYEGITPGQYKDLLSSPMR